MPSILNLMGRYLEISRIHWCWIKLKTYCGRRSTRTSSYGPCGQSTLWKDWWFPGTVNNHLVFHFLCYTHFAHFMKSLKFLPYGVYLRLTRCLSTFVHFPSFWNSGPIRANTWLFNKFDFFLWKWYLQ